MNTVERLKGAGSLRRWYWVVVAVVLLITLSLCVLRSNLAYHWEAGDFTELETTAQDSGYAGEHSQASPLIGLDEGEYHIRLDPFEAEGPVKVEVISKRHVSADNEVGRTFLSQVVSDSTQANELRFRPEEPVSDIQLVLSSS